MRVFLWFVVWLAFLNAVQASVVISQVLYDPVGTESGGEAVELRNNGISAIDISNWVLATESSASDATIPENTILQPNAVYLIADAGWSLSKDNPEWKNADLEETITMANSNSGIALKDASGAIIDAVGWDNPADIKQGLYEGTPAEGVAPGMALVRKQDTGNNFVDFEAGEPVFFSGEIVEIIVNISSQAVLPLGAVLYEDDSAEPGVQLKPIAGGTRALHLEVFYNGSSVNAEFFGKNIGLVKEGNVWKGELSLEYWHFGEQLIVVRTDSANMSIPVSILELKSVIVETKKVLLQGISGRTVSGQISVRNAGNVPYEVSWSNQDLFFGNEKISADNLVIVEKTVLPAKTEMIDVILNVPDNAVPGEYKTIVRMLE